MVVGSIDTDVSRSQPGLESMTTDEELMGGDELALVDEIERLASVVAGLRRCGSVREKVRALTGWRLERFMPVRGREWSRAHRETESIAVSSLQLRICWLSATESTTIIWWLGCRHCCTTGGGGRVGLAAW